MTALFKDNEGGFTTEFKSLDLGISQEVLDRKLTEEELTKAVEGEMPGLFEGCAVEEVDCVLMTQAAYAAGLHIVEFIRLGMAVKYAGLKGKEVRIIPHEN